MKIKQFKLARILWVAVAATFVTGCKYEKSNVTGWDYNNPKTGGFQKVPFEEQETGPGLVLIEGGTFTMGRVEQDVMYDWNNVPRRVTISSFYMDQFEVTNFNYLEYLYWINRTFASSFPAVFKAALPDTLVWRQKLAYNEPYVEYYLRHPAYRDYPVVGVSWLQATDFAKWRTDRVNEFILIREGVLDWYPSQSDDDVFDTDAYLAGQYESGVRQNLPDLDPNNAGQGKRGRKALGERIVRVSDGILLPRYRLPTEAEWEYAAYGLIGNTYDERIVERRIYPWTGHWVRNPEDKFQGEMLANFVRGRGDYMGVAGKLNDNADITAPVDAYWPNDYGLYNMAGNVSEWVLDVYRPLSSTDFDEFRPFRGNVFKTKVLNSEGTIEEKINVAQYDYYGILEFLQDFKKIRAENGRLTSYEDRMIQDIEDYVNRAIDFMKEGDDQLASEEIQEIFDNVLIAYDDSFPDYHKELPSMLRQGISDYLLHGDQENGASLPGSLRWRPVTAEENLQRRNYNIADNINYLDGDLESSHYYESRGTARGTLVKSTYNQQYNKSNEIGTDEVIARVNNDTTGIAWKKYEKNIMYQAVWDENKSGVVGQPTTLVSDRSRVYKGASWKDRAYWMNAGSRRFLDEDKATATIGFRCAMTRVGSPKGLGGKKRKKK